jgi:hypothetical protein
VGWQSTAHFSMLLSTTSLTKTRVKTLADFYLQKEQGGGRHRWFAPPRPAPQKQSELALRAVPRQKVKRSYTCEMNEMAQSLIRSFPLKFAAFCTSMWPPSQPRSGRDSNCGRHFPLPHSRATCCGTAMPSLAIISENKCETWASAKFCLRRAHLGREPMWNE